MEVLVDDLNTIFQKIDSLLTLNEYLESEFLRITLKTNLLEVVNFHMRILRYDSIYITNIYSEMETFSLFIKRWIYLMKEESVL